MSPASTTNHFRVSAPLQYVETAIPPSITLPEYRASRSHGKPNAGARIKSRLSRPLRPLYR